MCVRAGTRPLFFLRVETTCYIMAVLRLVPPTRVSVPLAAALVDLPILPPRSLRAPRRLGVLLSALSIEKEGNT